ncbi:MAG: class I SAM-dependent methyltransferase [Phycisphaerales bacterium]|nr:MAG: class I SAM-dependent methyltransferase [Phycisphaerales bacterium]
MSVPASPGSTMPPPARAAGQEVWDRVWSQRPSAAKDDGLLDRERRGPRWALIVRCLEATFGEIEGLRMIELGSGRGDLSALLAQRGANVTLLDQNEKALAEAKERFDRLGLAASFARGDLLSPLEEWSGRFDVALSSGVIEHFEGACRLQTVRAHHEVLRDGGVAVVSVPHARCPSYRLWKLYLELRGWWPYGVEIPYSKGELLRHAHRAGFAMVATHCVGFWQSVGDHWGRSLLKLGPDWVHKRSFLDKWFGATLLLFAWR